MHNSMRLSLGVLGAALLLAGCGQATPPPPKARPASPSSALHLTAGPVRAAAGGEHIVLLTAKGQKVNQNYTLTPSGASAHQLSAALGAREGGSWSVQYTEEGTSGRTTFVLSGPVRITSDAVVVTW